MIAVDTSALMAIVLKEPEADACKAALAAEGKILISAGTVAEALIVSARRSVDREVRAHHRPARIRGRGGDAGLRATDRRGLSKVGTRPAPGPKFWRLFRL